MSAKMLPPNADQMSHGWGMEERGGGDLRIVLSLDLITL